MLVVTALPLPSVILAEDKENNVDKTRLGIASKSSEPGKGLTT
jgi:hypothetical protein